MFTFERSYDWEKIRATMTHESIYRLLCDDSAPPAKAFQPNRDLQIWYIAVHKDGVYLGLWVLVPENAILADVHTCLLPIAWGEASAAAKEMAVWIWGHTQFERLTTKVPSYNRLAVRLAKMGGMEWWGTNPASWRRNGTLHSLIHLGMSKPSTISEPS